MLFTQIGNPSDQVQCNSVTVSINAQYNTHLQESVSFVKVTVLSPTQAPVVKTLGEAEYQVALSLIGGHAPSIASAVMEMKDV